MSSVNVIPSRMHQARDGRSLGTNLSMNHRTRNEVELCLLESTSTAFRNTTLNGVLTMLLDSVSLEKERFSSTLVEESVVNWKENAFVEISETVTVFSK